MAENYADELKPLDKSDSEVKGSKILFVMPTERELEAVDQKMTLFKAVAGKGSNNQLAPLGNTNSSAGDETNDQISTPQYPKIVKAMDAKVVPPTAAAVPKGVMLIKKEDAGIGSIFASAVNQDALARKVTAGKIAGVSTSDEFFDNPPPPPPPEEEQQGLFGKPKTRSLEKVYTVSDEVGAKADDSGKSIGRGSKKSENKSTHSYDSWGSGGSGSSGRGGKQLSDTIVRKLYFMMDSFISLVLLAIFAYGIGQLSSSVGMILPFNAYSFKHVGPIVAVLWARYTYQSADSALNKGLAAFIGWRMCQKDGYSIAACGFVHAGLDEKLRFANLLSFRSSCKAFLSKFSLIYLVHALMLILTCLTSSAISTNLSRINKGTLMCIQYDQNGVGVPWDRGIPTISNEMGGAQYMDGTALGIDSATTSGSILHLFPPQLIDVCQDGSTIVGTGYATNISSTCVCADSMTSAKLELAGIDSSVSTSMAAKALALGAFPGIVNSISYDNVSTIKITSLLTGSGYVCGAPVNSSVSVATSPSPVCFTTLTDHHKATIKVTYKTDGTPASIASKEAKYLEFVSSESGWWLHQSMLFLFGANITSNELPPYLPGTVNPLMWFASSNTQKIELALLPMGIQAYMAFMIRASMQRSYNTYGTSCVQEIINPTTVTLRIGAYGYYCGIIWAIFEFAIILLSFLLYVPWWMSEHPVLPAIEAANDPIIFAVHTTKNDTIMSRIKTMASNVETGLVWGRLDVVLRVGESVTTADDPERGVLVMDRPRLVTDLSYSKLYI